MTAQQPSNSLESDSTAVVKKFGRNQSNKMATVVAEADHKRPGSSLHFVAMSGIKIGICHLKAVLRKTPRDDETLC
jgi:hypothetical protein